MTVCTNSRYQKLSIHQALADTGNEEWGIPGRDGKMVTMSDSLHWSKRAVEIHMAVSWVTVWKKSANRKSIWILNKVSM